MTLEQELFDMLVEVGKVMIFLVGAGLCLIMFNIFTAAFWGDEDEGTSRKRRPRSERKKKNDQGPTLPKE